jgi:hypothetical protein
MAQNDCPPKQYLPGQPAHLVGVRPQLDQVVDEGQESGQRVDGGEEEHVAELKISETVKRSIATNNGATRVVNNKKSPAECLGL